HLGRPPPACAGVHGAGAPRRRLRLPREPGRGPGGRHRPARVGDAPVKIKTLRLDLLNQAVSVPDFTEMLDLDDEQEEATPVSDRVADAQGAHLEPRRSVVERTTRGQYAHRRPPQ